MQRYTYQTRGQELISVNWNQSAKLTNDTSIICYALRYEISGLIGYLLIKCELSGPDPVGGHVIREGVTEKKGE